VGVGVGGPPRPAHVTSQTGARGWVRRSAESVPHIDNCGAVFGGVRAAGQRRRAEGTAQRRQTSASHLSGGVPVCAREVIVRRRREERRKTRRSLRGCVVWTRTGIAHIRAAPPSSAEEEARRRRRGGGRSRRGGRGNAHTSASSSPAPSPVAPPVLLSIVSPPATGHTLQLLCIWPERTMRYAPGPRTTLADAESTARMWRRMEKREEEREREREEKRESGTCVTRCASTRSPHRLRRGDEGGGEMLDGDGDEESAHDVRRPAAPHTTRITRAERERHRWGGRSVGSHRCSGWGGAASALGTSSSTSVTCLTSFFVTSSLHPDAALRPLRVDYSSGSTTASNNHPRMARVHPAPLRLGARERMQGSLRSRHLNNLFHAAHNVVLC
jgi:hypothetical protein